MRIGFPVTDIQSVTGSFDTYIGESLFLYLHPVMGADFHPHVCALLQVCFILNHFVIRGIMNESREAQKQLTTIPNLL